jgi:hypothetical protein
MRNIKESDMYYPLLLVLKCYQGKATKEEITSDRGRFVGPTVMLQLGRFE